MAFGRVIRLDPIILSTVDILDHILIDNHTYAPEPSMEDEKRNI